MGEHGVGSALAQAVALAAPAAGVDAWTCNLSRSPSDIAAMERVLSQAELARAQRFGRPELRARYIVGRSTLRAILGTVLGVDAAQVVILRGRRGRPMVEGASVDFNVSHTRDTAIFAVATNARIGVDIEHRDRMVNVEGVGRKFMSPREQAMLHGLDGDAQRHALLRLWTCKEAMSKATGDALGAPFRKLDVVLDPAPSLRDGPQPYEPSRWRLLPVDISGGYLATVALWHAPASH
ncbi:MAG: 4'-phosphopantetheinyl transferase superfamily protein [Burkholderiales bacterium]